VWTRGDYAYVVVADTRDPLSGLRHVTAGASAPVSVILSYDVVTLSFIVTPTTIVDQYNVTLNINYSKIFRSRSAGSLLTPSIFIFPRGRVKRPLRLQSQHHQYSFHWQCSQFAFGCKPARYKSACWAATTRIFCQRYPVVSGREPGRKSDGAVPCYAVIDGATVPTHSVGNITVQANYDFSLDGALLQAQQRPTCCHLYKTSDLTYQPHFLYLRQEDGSSDPVLIYDGDGYVYDVKSIERRSLPYRSPLERRSTVTIWSHLRKLKAARPVAR